MIRAVLSAALVGTAMGSNHHVVPAFLRGAQNDVGAHVETNVCDLVWHYCRMDPDCPDYAMSADTVSVRALEHDPHVFATDMSPGEKMVAVYSGRYNMETLPKVEDYMTYRMYDAMGKNMKATGVLSDILTLNADGTWEATVPFLNEEGNFDLPQGHYKFVLDIFMERQGTHEATCIEVENIAMCSELSRKDDQYNMQCIDNGDGTFTPADPPIPLPCNIIPAPDCEPIPEDDEEPEPDCDLEWWYCPRDPDCEGYTMSTSEVTVRTDIGTDEREFFEPGDVVDVIVRGTTRLERIPPQATYRVYMLAGGNSGMGDLFDVLTIDKGSGEFEMVIPFVLVEGHFENSLGWFQFGIDVFQEAQGTNEAMCVEVANVPYREAMQAKAHPRFEQYCVDEGMGHFLPQTIDSVVTKAHCELHGDDKDDDE